MTAPPAFASAHIIRAYQASGLTPVAFADWLRAIAGRVETEGDRALVGVTTTGAP